MTPMAVTPAVVSFTPALATQRPRKGSALSPTTTGQRWLQALIRALVLGRRLEAFLGGVSRDGQVTIIIRYESELVEA